MRCMVDFLNGLYVRLIATYDPIIIKSDKIIHILIKLVRAEFHRGNTIFKRIIISKHIFLRVPILDLGIIMDRP